MTTYIVKDSSGHTVLKTLNAKRARKMKAERPNAKLIIIPVAR